MRAIKGKSIQSVEWSCTSRMQTEPRSTRAKLTTSAHQIARKNSTRTQSLTWTIAQGGNGPRAPCSVEVHRMPTGKAQPEGRERKKPGASGKGDYFHVAVRDKGQFTTFRTHDIGEPGGIQRVAGKRSSGSWDDQKWLIGKEQAHIEKGKLIPDTEDARAVLEALGSEPVHVGGDLFEAKPRVNVPEKDKPTAQRRAQQQNIRRKAQTARQK